MVRSGWIISLLSGGRPRCAVSRVRNAVDESIDVFWVSPSRSIEHSYYQNGQPWLHEPQVAPAGSAGPDASLAVVSRAANTMEVWWVGKDGSVQDRYYNAVREAYWYLGSPWNQFTLSGPNSADYRIAAVTPTDFLSRGRHRRPDGALP